MQTLEELKKLAKDQGWQLTTTGNGHIQWKPKLPGKAVVVTGSVLTRRNTENAIAQLRASGLVIPGKTPPALDLETVAAAVDTVDRKLDLLLDDYTDFKNNQAAIVTELRNAAKIDTLAFVTAQQLSDSHDALIELIDGLREELLATKDPLTAMRNRLMQGGR